MIDEELYQLAADELNSDRRKSDIWARACALASDDHDEARYLYTNLRVEEMLAEREAGNDPIAAAAALSPDRSDFPETDQSTADVVDHGETLNPQAYEGLSLEPLDLSHLAEEAVENDTSEIRISSMRPGIDASTNTDKLTDSDLDKAVEHEAVADVSDVAEDVLSVDEINKLGDVDAQNQVSSIPGSANLDMDAATDIDLNAQELGLNTRPDDGMLSIDDEDLAALGIGVEKTPEPAAPKITSLDALFDEVDDRVESFDGDIVDADIIESESLSSLVPQEHPATVAAKHNESADTEFTREMERQAEDLPSADNDVVAYTSKLESELPDMLQDENPSADFDDLAHDLSSVPEEVGPNTDAVVAAAGAVVATGGNAAREKVRTDYADKNDFRDDLDTEFLAAEEDDEYRDPVDLTDTGRGSRYAIYAKNNKAKAIRMGVSWTALFFTLPWLLYRRLFGTAILYTVLWLVLITGLLVTGLSWLDAGANVSNAQRLLAIGFGLLSVIGLLYIPFRYGNTWRATKLEKRGYDLAAWVRAKSPRKALNTARRAAALA